MAGVPVPDVLEGGVGGGGGGRGTTGLNDGRTPLLDGGGVDTLDPGIVVDDGEGGLALDDGVVEVNSHRGGVVAPDGHLR